jgi:hypothetical protein
MGYIFNPNSIILFLLLVSIIAVIFGQYHCYKYDMLVKKINKLTLTHTDIPIFDIHK